MKADKELVWEQIKRPTPQEVWRALRCERSINSPRSVYEVFRYRDGTYSAQQIDGGFRYGVIANSLSTMDAAKKMCQNLRNKELRREAWDEYMLNHDPPEGDENGTTINS